MLPTPRLPPNPYQDQDWAGRQGPTRRPGTQPQEPTTGRGTGTEKGTKVAQGEAPKRGRTEYAQRRT